MYVDSQEYQEIKKIAEQTTFFERLRPLYRIIRWLFLPALILWSVVTEFGFLYSFIYRITNAVGLATALTILLVSLIELAKVLGGVYAVRFFAQGWVAERPGRYVPFIFVLGMMVLPAYAGSFFLSVRGAPDLVENVHHLTTTLPQIDIDSLNTKYDLRIKSEQKKQVDAHNTKWRGSITVGATRLSNTIQETISVIEQQRAQEIAQATAENNRRLQVETIKVEKLGGWLQGFGGFAEVFTVICLVLLGMFERYAIEEDPDSSPTHSHQVPINIKPKTIVKQQAIENSNHRAEIKGFSIGLNSAEGQKEGVHTIAHTNTRGITIHYTPRDVRGFIQKYNKRLVKAQDEGARINNQRWVEYWEGRMKEFKS